MSDIFNVGDFVDRSQNPDKTLITDLFHPPERQIYTHGEMDRLAMSAARLLTKRGLPKGSRIAIISPNRVEYIVAYFGILRAGHVAVPVNHKTSVETISYVLKDADVRLAFVDSTQAARVPPGLNAINFDDAGPNGWTAQLDPGDFVTFRPEADDFCEILYTSGSTGRPKGVPLTHAGQLWTITRRRRPIDQVAILVQPLFHMAGLFAPRIAVMSHASLIMLPAFDPRTYIKTVIDYRVTAIQAVPTVLARIVKEEDLLTNNALGHVRTIALGSAPLTEALYEKIRATFPGATLSNGYGSTEAGGGVFGSHPDGLPTPPVSLGYPLSGLSLKLVDGPNEDEAVLMVRSPAMLPYYLNLPEQTAKVMRDGWYYTGDVMRRDADGFYWFVGRADDMFVCSGENIYPGELEKLLEAHPQIHQACVVPIADSERGQVPTAFVVLGQGESVSVEDIKKYTIDNGPAYQHPRRVKLLTELPWAGTNKIDRNVLRRQAEELEKTSSWSP
jgi:long-chain acyl-CoA synthetase